MFQTLRDRCKQVEGHETVLGEMLAQALDYVKAERFHSPDEKFRYIRALPHLLLLINSKEDEAYNVFKKLPKDVREDAKRVVRDFPIVPQYGDIPFSAHVILAGIPSYDAESMGREWGQEDRLDKKALEKLREKYSLRAHFEGIVRQHGEYEARLCHTLQELRLTASARAPRSRRTPSSCSASCSRASSCSARGTRASSRRTRVEAHAPRGPAARGGGGRRRGRRRRRRRRWRRRRRRAARARVRGGRAAQLFARRALDARVVRRPLEEPRGAARAPRAAVRAVRAARDPPRDAAARAGRPRRAAAPRAQAQARAARPAARAAPARGRLGPDAASGDRRDDYVAYSRQHGKVALDPARSCTRVVGPSTTQLQLVRTMVRAMYDERSQHKTGVLFDRKKDLEPDELERFKAFYDASGSWAALLDVGASLRGIADLGDLWYREMYLEITAQIQFPIEMSLPWILTEHVILNPRPDVPMIESILHTLDVYNDAAHRALYVLCQQTLYDEIEAEVNLVFDQFLYLIADELYSHCKNRASVGALRARLRAPAARGRERRQGRAQAAARAPRRRGARAAAHPPARAEHRPERAHRPARDEQAAQGRRLLRAPLRERGRGGRRRAARRARRRARDARAARGARRARAVRQPARGGERRGRAGELHGRVFMHALRSVARRPAAQLGVQPAHTRRFVRSVVQIRAVQREPAHKVAQKNLAFGEAAHKAWEASAKLGREFFGRPHVDALVALLAPADVPSLVQNLLNKVREKLQLLKLYMDAITEGLPPSKLPKLVYGLVGCYGLFEVRLKPILEYDDLKPEVFQAFREVGNPARLRARPLGRARARVGRARARLCARALGVGERAAWADAVATLAPRRRASPGGGGGGTRARRRRRRRPARARARGAARATRSPSSRARSRARRTSRRSCARASRARARGSPRRSGSRSARPTSSSARCGRRRSRASRRCSPSRTASSATGRARAGRPRTAWSRSRTRRSSTGCGPRSRSSSTRSRSRTKARPRPGATRRRCARSTTSSSSATASTSPARRSSACSASARASSCSTSPRTSSRSRATTRSRRAASASATRTRPRRARRSSAAAGEARGADKPPAAHADIKRSAEDCARQGARPRGAPRHRLRDGRARAPGAPARKRSRRPRASSERGPDREPRSRGDGRLFGISGVGASGARAGARADVAIMVMAAI